MEEERRLKKEFKIAADAESDEDGGFILKKAKEEESEEEANLAEKAAKRKARKRAYSLEYRKRPEVVARRKATEAERAEKKKAKNEAERVEKNKAPNGAYNVDPVSESTFISQDSLDFEEVP
jgi:hypothetical protein